MLEEIFTGKCPVCGGSCALREPLCGLCRACLDEVGPPCPVCGFPLRSEGACCPSCSGRRGFPYGRVYAAYRYSGVMRKLLLSVKFRYNLRSAFTLPSLIKLPEGLDMAVYDAVVPVPSHMVRRFRRFRHPADTAAGYMSGVYGVPLLKALYRKRNTVFQYGLKSKERAGNVKGAFGAYFEENPLNILLVDDIFTTGSTLTECAGLLKAHGSVRIDCFVIAID